MTYGRKAVIEPLVFSVADTRKLATGLLIVLATYDDKFAQELLDDHFQTDDGGWFHWPDRSSE